MFDKYTDETIELQLKDIARDSRSRDLLRFIIQVYYLRRGELSDPYVQRIVIDEVAPFTRLSWLNFRFSGLCDIVSNCVIAQDLLGEETEQLVWESAVLTALAGVLEFAVPKAEFSNPNREQLTLDRLGQFATTHILDNNLLHHKALAYFLDVYPFNLFTVEETKRINQTHNTQLIGDKLNQLPDGTYIKYEVYSKYITGLNGHSMVIKKVAHDRFHCFDPNTGTNFNSNTLKMLQFVQDKSSHESHQVFIDGQKYIESLGLRVQYTGKSVAPPTPFRQSLASIFSSIEALNKEPKLTEAVLIEWHKKLTSIIENNIQRPLSYSLQQVSRSYLRDALSYPHKMTEVSNVNRTQLKRQIASQRWFMFAKSGEKSSSMSELDDKFGHFNGMMLVGSYLGTKSLYFFDANQQSLRKISNKEPNYSAMIQLIENKSSFDVDIATLEEGYQVGRLLKLSDAEVLARYTQFTTSLHTEVKTPQDFAQLMNIQINSKGSNPKYPFDAEFVMTLFHDELLAWVKTPLQFKQLIHCLEQANTNAQIRHDHIHELIQRLLPAVISGIKTGYGYEAVCFVLTKRRESALLKLVDEAIPHPETLIHSVADLGDVLKHRDKKKVVEIFDAFLKEDRWDELLNQHQNTLYDFYQAMVVLKPVDRHGIVISKLLDSLPHLVIDKLVLVFELKEMLSKAQWNSFIELAAKPIAKALVDRSGPMRANFLSKDKHYSTRDFLNTCSPSQLAAIMSHVDAGDLDLSAHDFVLEDALFLRLFVTGIPDNIHSAHDFVKILQADGLTLPETQSIREKMLPKISSLVRTEYDVLLVRPFITPEDTNSFDHLVETLIKFMPSSLSRPQAESLSSAILKRDKEAIDAMFGELLRPQTQSMFNTRFFRDSDRVAATLACFNLLNFSYQQQIAEILNFKQDNNAASLHVQFKQYIRELEKSVVQSQKTIR